jgi:hypothetical protein
MLLAMNGVDPRAYIVSVNLPRRNLSIAQKTMLYAIAHPEPEKGWRTLSTGRDNLGSNPRSVRSKHLEGADDIARGARSCRTGRGARSHASRAGIEPSRPYPS